MVALATQMESMVPADCIAGRHLLVAVRMLAAGAGMSVEAERRKLHLHSRREWQKRCRQEYRKLVEMGVGHPRVAH